MSFPRPLSFVLFLLVLSFWLCPSPARAAGQGTSAQGTLENPRFQASSPGFFSLPANRWGGKFTISADGVEIEPRPQTSPAWIGVSAIGREGSLASLWEGTLHQEETRLGVDYGPLALWYRPESQGLNISFTILPPQPPGQGPLLLHLALLGPFASWSVPGERLTLILGEDETEGLRWNLLSASDASGRQLGLSWEQAENGLLMAVEDQGAVYPITVSSALTAPVWITDGEQEYAFHGVWLAGAGDVNGDGFMDVLVGAYQYDEPELEEGRALLYAGSAGGLSTAPSWTAKGEQPGAFFGRRVAGAGDVNQDGFDDILVSATGFEDGEAGEGKVFLYLGSALGPGLIPAWTAEGNQADAAFGISIAGAGDVNKDGYADVLVGAANWDGAVSDCGKAFLYLGSSAGLSLTPSWTYEGSQKEELLGLQVAGAGDVNHDGYPDVLVGAPQFSNGQAQEGRALLFLGSAAGLSPSPAWSFEGQQAGALFGGSVSGAGDVNKDGFDDIIVGARLYDGTHTNEGRASLFLGSASGLSANPAWNATGNQAEASFGVNVSGLGDTNADGYADVLVGAFLYDGTKIDEGRASVFLGTPGGLSASAAFTIGSAQDNARLGFSTGNAGDVNGDSFADALVGAHFFTATYTQEGRAYLFPGPLVAPTFGLKLPAANAGVDATPPPTFSWFPGDRVKFKVEWSAKPSFSSKVNSGSKNLTTTTFTPSASLWKKILALGKKTGVVYWRVLGLDAKNKKLYTAGRTLQVPH